MSEFYCMRVCLPAFSLQSLSANAASCVKCGFVITEKFQRSGNFKARMRASFSIIFKKKFWKKSSLTLRCLSRLERHTDSNIDHP